MPEDQTLPLPAEHREFIVTINGEVVSGREQLLNASVFNAAGKLASARLIYLDGSSSDSDFPLSNTSQFVPGNEIEITAGTGNIKQTLFNGIIINQRLKIRENSAPQLIVECRHKTVALSVGRRSAYYFDLTDSEIVKQILNKYGLDSQVESSSVVHKQLVQYYATDWDFILMRAEVNGMLVFTNGNTVLVKAPVFDEQPVCTLHFGSTILEMDAEMESREQYKQVSTFFWDAAQQCVIEKEAEEPAFNEQGNLTSSALASVINLEDWRLQHSSVTEEEAQAWADSQWMKSKLGKICGRIKCEGIGTVNPGNTITLSGVGARYNGTVFVSGVRHELDLVQGWKTHIQFGISVGWFAEEHRVGSTSAGALLPSVNGLQIGIVTGHEDPDGEFRVRVKMPMVNNDDEGTWARFAAPDAGKERGFFFRPEIGDEVVIGFFDNDPRHAVILGMLHSSAKSAPLNGTDSNNEKIFQSRSKMQLFFDDDKKILFLKTPAGNSITFDETERKIGIADQNGNTIDMTENGITISSSKALELKAGTEIKIEAGTSLNLNGSANIKMDGSSGVEIKSSGMIQVNGSMITLN